METLYQHMALSKHFETERERWVGESMQGCTYCIFLVRVIFEHIEERSQYFIHPLNISYT